MFDTSFTQPHVFIIGDGSIFDKSVTQLLTQETNLFVSHTIYSEDLAFLNLIRWEHRAEVIVVNESGSLYLEHILAKLSLHSKVIRLRIVVARLYQNTINIYASPIFVAEKRVFRPRRITPLTDNNLLNAVRRKHSGQFFPFGNFAQFLRAVRFPPIFETDRKYLNSRFVENRADSQDRATLHTHLKEKPYEEMQ